MSVKVQLKHSATANKAPQPADLVDGELALNINSASPAAYIKDSAGNIVKLAGAGAIGGTPATETAAGIVELATAAETTTGTDNTRAVHPAGLKVELDKKAPLASPALTGTPTAPTAAAGTNTTQVATTEFVTAAVAVENLWDRTGTELSPATAGDSVFTTGAVKVGGTTAAPNIEVKADGGIVANTDGLVYDAANKRLGVGSTTPGGTLDIKAAAATDPLIVQGPSSEFTRIDASGRLLVGTSSARSNFFNTSAFSGLLQIEGTSDPTRVISFVHNTSGQEQPLLVLGKSRGTTAGSNTAVQNNDTLGTLSFQGADGTELVEAARISCDVDGTSGANDMPGRLVFSTTADGASSPTERMRISQSGNVSIGVASDSGFHEIRKSGGLETSGIAGFSTSGSNYPVAIYQVTGSGANTAAAAMLVGKGSVTSRSINAGGTVNASGADYAEYMTKAGDFDISKGAVCGVTSDGLLTLDYGDAVSFVVKSTNPSYVGGDTWGSEDIVGKRPGEDDKDALAQWEADLEAARQQVDRIAFAGQVPVNVMGATPGQYIVPIEAADGGIEGVAKDEADLTLSEYMRSVGKVIAIEDDGRARIIVKVA